MKMLSSSSYWDQRSRFLPGRFKLWSHKGISEVRKIFKSKYYIILNSLRTRKVCDIRCDLER
jgi:hypothetical protein